MPVGFQVSGVLTALGPDTSTPRAAEWWATRRRPHRAGDQPPADPQMAVDVHAHVLLPDVEALVAGQPGLAATRRRATGYPGLESAAENEALSDTSPSTSKSPRRPFALGTSAGISMLLSLAHVDSAMPSQAMQDVISAFLQRREGASGKPKLTLGDRRAAFGPAGAVYPLPDDVSVTAVVAGAVPAHWLATPDVDPGRVLVYLHGGGYTMGSIRSHGELAARLGRDSGCRVLVPEYRLAPEHPFPAALDDALSAWRWLRNSQALPASSLAVVGDSAGGGLGLALLLQLRDNGEDLPAALALMSPWTDLTLSGAAMSEPVRDPVLTPDGVRQLAKDYLAGTQPTNVLASPLFASLSGLPPMLVQVGGAELLLSDSQRLADAAQAAGVDVTLEIRDGLPHVYQSVVLAPEATLATAAMGRFLRTRMTGRR